VSDFYESSQEVQVDALRELACDALKQYEGHFTAPELVKYRENAIFSIYDENGRRFALRIHRPNYHSDGALGSELAWMQSLSDNGLPVPTVQLNRMDQPITLAEAAGVPEARRVDLISWVRGTPLGKIEEEQGLSEHTRRRIYRSIGSLTANLHEHANKWAIARDVERPSWFADGLVGEHPLWGRFWDLPALSVEQKIAIRDMRDDGRRFLANYPRHVGNSGLIHADLIADNMMVDGDVISPIDFDDAGFGWHMFDLATTLYFLSEDPHFESIKTALIDGYRQVRELPDEEVASLPAFLMLRGTTYLGWVATRGETATARDLAPYLVKRAFSAWEGYRRVS